MFVLKELLLVNFRSWKELRLTDIHKKRLCVIQGDNGSGKSSIRQAIEYLLTDKITEDFPLDEMPFNKTESCTLRGVFSKDTDEIVITKYRNHSKYNNSTYLSVNGDDSLSRTDRRETQKEIEKLFGIDSETLSISTIFSEGSVSFPEAKEVERKDIVYAYLDFSEYIRLYNLVKDKLNKLENNLNTVKYQIEFKQKLINSFEKEKEERKNKADKFEIDREYSIVSLEKEIKYNKELLSSIEDDIVRKIEGEKRNLKEIDVDLYEELKEHINAINDVYIKNSAMLPSLVKEIQTLQKSLCPVLNDFCDRIFIKNDIILSEKRNKERSLRLRLENLKIAQDFYGDKFVVLDEQVVENQKIQKNINKLQTQLLEVKKTKESLKEKLAKAEASLELKKTSINPYKSEDLSAIDKNSYYAARSKIKYESLLKKLEEEIPYYKFWLTGFSKTGIPNMKIEGFLQALEMKTNEYLSAISDRIYITISSQTELKNKDVKEKISYKVFHPERTITDYKTYSSGQKQRIKIADIFAMHQLLSKFNFIILDEVLDLSLDDQGKESIINLLKIRSKEIDTIFVMSHDPRVKGSFENVIEVKLVDGESILC